MILFASKFHLSASSTGDNTVLFRSCLQNCRLQFECPTFTTAFGWTSQNCFGCRQNCVWKTVEQFKSFGQKVPQFFGKWPFQPVTFNFVIFSVSIQEPASTTFSLFNLHGMVRMLQRIQQTIPSDYRCFWVWKWFCYVGIFGWVSSALFHSCDFLLTEYLDYLSACAIIVTSLFACVSFIFPNYSCLKVGVFYGKWLLSYALPVSLACPLLNLLSSF
uniref:Post-GPI attachment to proteins factor 3 n=1 Tax=Ditylenchus dipsaci TaxID=166011 RepID=A0A915CPA1_9BILA